MTFSDHRRVTGRRSGRSRTAPRPRRRIPRALLFLLAPIYRYDVRCDAWILRVVGNRYGPVVRPSGDRVSPPDEDHTDNDNDKDPAADAPAVVDTPEPARRTPDPFEPQPPNRAHVRRNDRSSAQEEEPPPLIIRPRREPPPLIIRPRRK